VSTPTQVLTRDEAKVRYRPGLDGLRAVAVVAVIVFHANREWLPGGFLGVDLFFVISGYLICSLVLKEHRRSNTVSFVAFWGRRARRLLPALYALLVGVSVVSLTVVRSAAAGLFGDVVAALLYVSNWWLIWGGDSYFDTFGRPPLLRHLWSLAVEEQFYIVFPILMAGLLRVFGRRRGPIAAAALVGALASTIEMAWLFVPGEDPSRVYYGTDTRASGLLVGVALGALWPADELPYDPRQRAVLDRVGVASLAALAAMMLLFHEDSTLLFQGGFLLVSLAAAVAIAVAVHPVSTFGEVLGVAPLRWIGTRSYALYLWHWPVLILTAPDNGDFRQGPPLAVKLAIVAVLAELSWRFVEQPVRTGRVQRWWEASDLTARKVVLATTSVAILALGIGLFVNRQDDVPELLADGTTRVTPELPPPVRTRSRQPTAPAPPATPTTQPPTPTTQPEVMPLPPVLAIGDSVMLGARDALAFASGGAIAVDADVSRQVDDGLDLLQDYRDSGDLRRFRGLVWHLGTNGPFTVDQAQRLLDLTHGLRRVVVVNTRVPQPWEDDTNDTVSALAGRPHVRIADWYAASSDGDLLTGDGVHPTPPGAAMYARVIVEALRAFETGG
jgi:peptidoglycan/LPS O-acetylase OafA/YrhL